MHPQAHPHPHPHPLVATNALLLDQALALARFFVGARAPGFAALVGPHLRHVIEHLEALLLRPMADELDYDGRLRDQALERQPALAVERLQALQQALAGLGAWQLAQAVTVCGQTGLAGEWRFATASTVGRELAVMASHTVHHFALLRAHCVQLGWAAPDDFGHAPATVAHARRAQPPTSSLS